MYNHIVQIKKNDVYNAHIMFGGGEQIGLQKHVGVNQDRGINYT